MKRFIGVIPGFQRVAFYGIVALFISFFAYDLNFSSVVSCAFKPTSFSAGFKAYMFWSIVAYPVITLLYAVGRKYWSVGASIMHYDEWNILALMVQDIVGNIIVPFIFLGMIFDSIVRKQDIFGITDVIDLILFIINVLYIVISFIIVF